MSWYIVHFLEEDTVECVPNSWYIDTSKECFWPPTKTQRYKIQDFIRNRYTPSETWHPFKVKVLGNYDDLNIALKKAKKAEYFDDLSSSYGETIPDKRRIKRNKKYRTSESSYASSEDDLNFPSVPKTMGKRQSEDDKVTSESSRASACCTQRTDLIGSTLKSPCNSTDTPTNVTLTDSEGNIENCESTKASVYSTIKNDLISSTPKLASTFNSRHLTSKNSEEIRETDEFSKSQTCKVIRPSTSRPKNDLSTSSQSSTLTFTPRHLSKSSEDFQLSVSTQLTNINTKIDMILESLDLLMRKSTFQRETEFIKKKSELGEISNIFPMGNQESLNKLEEWLKVDTINIHTLANELVHIGGSSVKELVRRIMYRLFDNILGNHYTWEGANQKLKFKTLSVSKVIIESARTLFTNATEMEIIGLIKLWLVRCKDREQKKILKNNP